MTLYNYEIQKYIGRIDAIWGIDGMYREDCSRHGMAGTIIG